MNQALLKEYEKLGISEAVFRFGEAIEASLRERFEEIDARAELNQMKVIRAMQKNRVSAECFQMSSGYGYNDLGRDTLEKVYADCFGGEDALVRPQITKPYLSERSKSLFQSSSESTVPVGLLGEQTNSS